MKSEILAKLIRKLGGDPSGATNKTQLLDKLCECEIGASYDLILETSAMDVNGELSASSLKIVSGDIVNCRDKINSGSPCRAVLLVREVYGDVVNSMDIPLYASINGDKLELAAVYANGSPQMCSFKISTDGTFSDIVSCILSAS